MNAVPLSFLMLNCYYCLDGTRSGYFGHVTPMLEDYLPLDEQLLPPPGIDLGGTWDFWIQGPHNTWLQILTFLMLSKVSFEDMFSCLPNKMAQHS